METSEPITATDAPPLHRVFRPVVATVVPSAAELDDSAWSELEALVLESLRRRPASVQRKLRLFLKLIQWLPLLPHGTPFTSLDPERRARFLTRLQEHPLPVIRVGFWGLRTLALLGYYGRAGGGREIGYRPDPLGWDKYRP
jgi:hypothetical protein